MQHKTGFTKRLYYRTPCVHKSCIDTTIPLEILKFIIYNFEKRLLVKGNILASGKMLNSENILDMADHRVIRTLLLVVYV